ncbi:MAG: class I SAM-dependent methyltransferase [Pseudomonadota bacterium]
MDDTLQALRQQGQDLWRSGRYGAATRSFAGAARYGQERDILALLRALLALGNLSEAAKLVAFWRQRSPDSGALAAYEVLLLWAAGRTVEARVAARRLDASPFCQAVAWAVDAAASPATRAAPSPASPPWSDAMDGMSHLLPQSDLAWLAFPSNVLNWALENAPTGGLCVECGVFWGRSIRLLAARRDQVHGFDSFAGLPEAWKDGEPEGAYSTGGRLPQVPANVLLYKGWFDQTLPAFVSDQVQPLDLLHVDCDLYSSTLTVLHAFAPLLREGTVIVFDDYMGFAGWRDHEHRALEEFSKSRGMTYAYRAAAMLGREVAITVTDPGSDRS